MTKTQYLQLQSSTTTKNTCLISPATQCGRRDKMSSPFINRMPPPPSPARTRSVSVSSASSRKRKREDDEESSTSRRPSLVSERSSGPEFSKSTRRKVENADGGSCWFCQATPVEICHVIGQKDHGVCSPLHCHQQNTHSLQFNDLVSKKLLCFNDLNHPDNAIPLCPTCHRNFDDIIQPGFVFIPTDLDYFIHYEEEDQKRRRLLGPDEEGNFPGRYGVPSAESYRDHQRATKDIPDNAVSGLYTRYVLRKFLPPMITYGLGSFQQAKPWHGSPAAALRRACMVLGNMATPKGAIPNEVRKKLQKLADLWMEVDVDWWDHSIAVDVNSLSSTLDDSENETKRPSRRNTLRQQRRDGKASNASSNAALPVEKSEDVKEGAVHDTDASKDAPQNNIGSPELRAESPPSLEFDGHTICASDDSSHPATKNTNDNAKIRPKSWTWGPGATSQDAVDFFSAVKDT
jgi:hypothetical protein